MYLLNFPSIYASGLFCFTRFIISENIRFSLRKLRDSLIFSGRFFAPIFTAHKPINGILTASILYISSYLTANSELLLSFNFLNLNELNILHTTPKDMFPARYETYGGYDLSERQMVAFLPDALCYDYVYPISILKIDFLYTFYHRFPSFFVSRNDCAICQIRNPSCFFSQSFC